MGFYVVDDLVMLVFTKVVLLLFAVVFCLFL